MRYAIVSDIHNRRRKLEAVLADAQARRADKTISLGDVGGDECLALLHRAGALAVFGNYEVSGWRRLSSQNRSWVRHWPPLLAEDGFVAVHAAPGWPAGLQSVIDFGNWLETTGRPWRALFPYLTEDSDALWRALAELEIAGRSTLFHGHTHRQAIWQWQPDGHLRPLQVGSNRVEAGSRYVVGVGSVGLPEDGGWARYTLFDADTRHLESIRLKRPRLPAW
jgi:diadenosine tetraphosphatase ApaH/serine/threonine PP2A family protein phosphatase